MKNSIAFFVANIFQAGGIERVVTKISNSLSKEYNITIISLYKTNKEPYFNLHDNIRIEYLFDKKIKIRLNYIKIRKKLKKILNDIDCHYFINCGMGYVPFTIFVRKKHKYIAWEHSNCNIGKKYGLTWTGRVLSNKYADAIVFLTKKDLKNFIIKFNNGNKSNKYYQIYNPSNGQSTKKYNISSRKIMSCGRLSYQKGYDYLIKVARIVFNNPASKGWEWDIYGEGELKTDIQKSINDENLNEKIHLKGNSDLVNIYPKYGIFVLTSRYEGFCMVNIEASENNLPIVSFNCDCGPDEIIIDSKNGYLIPCYETEIMAEKIIKLIRDDKLRLSFSKNTIIDKDKLDINTVTAQWKTLLKTVA